jgi:hypothetical protein
VRAAAVGFGAECADEKMLTLSTLMMPICDEMMT